jgi:hypothetical protein
VYCRSPLVWTVDDALARHAATARSRASTRAFQSKLRSSRRPASRSTSRPQHREVVVGGETEFPELGKRIVPHRSRALLQHSALGVTSGVKYVLRTDILFRSDR